MKCVFQKNLDIASGDCFPACVASLLEMDLSAVPNFCTAGENWYTIFQNWLIERRMYAITIKLIGEAALYPIPQGLVCIVTGASPRHSGCLHSIVCKTQMENGKPFFDPVHDPHPDGTMIRGAAKEVTFLVKPAGANRIVKRLDEMIH